MKINAFAAAAAIAALASAGVAQPQEDSSPAPSRPTFEELAAKLFKGKETETLTPAVTPLAALPFEGAEAEALASGRGIASDGSMLAEQPLRALDAIVVTLENRRLVLPLTIFGKVETGADGAAVIPTDLSRRGWCNSRDYVADGLYCYVDKDGDGRIETRRRAHSRFDRNPIAVDYVHEEEPVDPFPYMAAAEDDYPTYTLQYRSCESDNEKIIYSISVDIPDRPDLEGGGCQKLADPLGGIGHGSAGRYKVDRVVVQKTGAGADAEFRLITPIEAGTIFDRIDAGEALVDLGGREAWWQEKMRDSAGMRKPPYILTAGPNVVNATGREGDIMFEGTLGYSYTGRVTNEAISDRPFSKGSRDLAEGQFVYGLPMRLSDGRGQTLSEPTMYWCAPIEESEGKWRATCVRSGEASIAVKHDVTPAFMTQHILGYWRKSEAVSIKEEPLSFPVPIEVRYEFRDWDERRLTIRIHSGPGGGRRDWVQVNVPRPEGGPALVRLGGGLYEISPTPDGGYQIVVKKQPRPGGSALPSLNLELPDEIKESLGR